MPRNPSMAIAQSVVMLTAAIAIEVRRVANYVTSSELRAEKAVKSNCVKRCRVACRDRNPSRPAAESVDQQITCRESRK